MTFAGTHGDVPTNLAVLELFALAHPLVAGVGEGVRLLPVQ